MLEQIKELLLMLKRLEFQYDGEWGEFFCPVCSGREDRGHKENCELNSLIRKYQ